ncbi:MAG: histidine kinase dimerization/phospho-acceptor domain-containing protein [Pseudomonadota bacterium]
MYKVLILDNSKLAFKTLEKHLDSELFLLQRADCPTEMLDYIEASLPDCIILNTQASSYDPLLLCGTLKGDRRAQHIPFLYLISELDQKLACALLSAGAYDCLPNDSSLDFLTAKILSMISLKNDYVELHQLRRFQGLGESLSIFSHDFNNPLTIALGNVLWLSRNITDQSQSLRLGRISEALDRMAKLIVKIRSLRESSLTPFQEVETKPEGT